MKEDTSQRPFTSDYEIDCFAVTPISNFPLSGYLKQYATHLISQGHRVTLSGIGGDQPTGGGIPTPTPELQNLLVKARFVSLAHQLNAWGTKMRKPRIPLLWEAVRGFFPLAFAGMAKDVCPVPWLNPSFARRNHAALHSYPSRVKVFGPLPSFQDHLIALNCERRLLALLTLQQGLLRDRRYPYYDRDFLEFMYAIPREQIVRVGQRRSLMKRALVGIVPHEVLNRRRKEFVQQDSPKDSAEWTILIDRNQRMVSSSMGIIDAHRFAETLQKARRHEQVLVGSLTRTLTLEFWLRHLTLHGVLKSPTLIEGPDYHPRPSACAELTAKPSEDLPLAPIEAQAPNA